MYLKMNCFLLFPVNMFTMGAAFGIPNHFWYLKLDRILPGVSASVVLRKILLDEAIASPVLIIAFLVGKQKCTDHSFWCISHTVSYAPSTVEL